MYTHVGRSPSILVVGTNTPTNYRQMDMLSVPTFMWQLKSVPCVVQNVERLIVLFLVQRCVLLIIRFR